MAKGIEYKIITANEFLKAKPSGEFDREESKKMLVNIAVFAGCSADYEILIDARQAYGNLTFVDMYEFVKELGKHRNAFLNKIAVLSRNDRQFDNAHFMELCATNKGFQVGAFTDFEEAIDWLITSVEVDINDPCKELLR